MQSFVIIILVFVGFLGLMDVVEYDFRQYESPFIFVFAWLLCLWKALAIVGCWRLAGKVKRNGVRKALRGAVAVGAAVYCLLCLVNGISTSLYGFGLTRRLITVLLQTNAKETWEFLPVLLSNVNVSDIAPVLLMLLAVVAVSVKRRKLAARRKEGNQEFRSWRGWSRTRREDRDNT